MHDLDMIHCQKTVDIKESIEINTSTFWLRKVSSSKNCTELLNSGIVYVHIIIVLI